MTANTGSLVVVGLDDSVAARNAVQWAALEATRRRTGLRLVHAYRPGAEIGPDDNSANEPDTTPRIEGQALVSTVASDLRACYPHLEISTHLDQRPPAEALRDQSAGAQLTVVGSRSRGVVAGSPQESVAFALASQHSGPIAVIHPGHHPNTQGSVIIGVDGSATNEQAIEFAFAEAELRHADLIAVFVWHDVDIDAASLNGSTTDAVPTGITEERRQLVERLLPWREKFPDVALRPVVVYGSPAATLLDFASRAQLLVLGSHGRGRPTGLLLGPSGQALVDQSSCPVVVVHPGPGS